jgi:hypothetical protein
MLARVGALLRRHAPMARSDRAGPGRRTANEVDMTAIRIVALALIVAGVLALGVVSLRYLNASRSLDLGAMDRFFASRSTVRIPPWAGVAMIGAGGVLLLFGTSRRR